MKVRIKYNKRRKIMYTLTTQQSFDSAHFLAGYNGKCGNIHGHRWRVILKIKTADLIEEGQQRGMCIDFADVKDDLKKVTDYYDHSFIYEKGTLKEKTIEALNEENFRLIEVSFRPTAENFAKHFYDMFVQKGYDVAEVMVYETPNNCASYCE